VVRAREIETRRAFNRSALEFILAYYDLLEANKLLQVAAGEVKQYEAHLHDANVRYQAGVVTRNEMLQAEVSLADSRQRYLVPRASHFLRRARSTVLRPLDEPVHAAKSQTPSTGIHDCMGGS
jgi:outer membrane protein TolC